jgi:hypothetical protein
MTVRDLSGVVTSIVVEPPLDNFRVYEVLMSFADVIAKLQFVAKCLKCRTLTLYPRCRSCLIVVFTH